MLPDGWDKKILQNVLDTLKDGTHFSPKSKNGPYKYITSKNIRFGIMDLNNISYISEEEHQKIFKSSPVYLGDVLLTKDGANTGNAALNTLKEEFSLLSSVAILRGKSGELENKFLLQLLLSPIGQNVIRSEMAGQAITRLTLRTIGGMRFSIPPLPEQNKIAQILSTWDNAIRTTEKLLANSQQQKKALMQQLLTGKKRLPGFSGEWETVKLSSLCDIRRGASPRPIRDNKWFSKAGRGWIRISDVTIQQGPYLLKTTQYLSQLGVEKSVTVEPGDLIMSICGTIGVPKFLGIKACIHDGFVVFRNINKNLCLKYLYHHIKFISDRLSAGGQPGTQKNLNTSIVSGIQYPNIDVKEQTAIAAVLTNADKDINTLKQKLDYLKQEKKALMQQLLTGKRRVKTPHA